MVLFILARIRHWHHNRQAVHVQNSDQCGDRGIYIRFVWAGIHVRHLEGLALLRGHPCIIRSRVSASASLVFLEP